LRSCNTSTWSIPDIVSDPRHYPSERINIQHMNGFPSLDNSVLISMVLEQRLVSMHVHLYSVVHNFEASELDRHYWCPNVNRLNCSARCIGHRQRNIFIALNYILGFGNDSKMHSRLLWTGRLWERHAMTNLFRL